MTSPGVDECKTMHCATFIKMRGYIVAFKFALSFSNLYFVEARKRIKKH